MKVGRPNGSSTAPDSLLAPRSNADVMDAREVCAYLHIHRSTLYRLIGRDEIPYFRIGYHYRFNREQIDEWRQYREFR
jgi:excisionase family DNA binding protein